MLQIPSSSQKVHKRKFCFRQIFCVAIIRTATCMVSSFQAMSAISCLTCHFDNINVYFLQSRQQGTLHWYQNENGNDIVDAFCNTIKAVSRRWCQNNMYQDGSCNTHSGMLIEIHCGCWLKPGWVVQYPLWMSRTGRAIPTVDVD